MDKVCGQIPDEALALAAKAGDPAAQEALFVRYKGIVRAKARPYFLFGGDQEDLVQEGMIGLHKAVRDFDPAQGSPFRAFAEVCILRHMMTAIQSAARQKHAPLNSYVSFYRDGEEAGQSLLDTLELTDAGPEDALITQETMDALHEWMETRLTPMEKNVVRLFLEGLSYEQIAAALGYNKKTVDNALQRVKKKLEQEWKKPENGNA